MTLIGGEDMYNVLKIHLGLSKFNLGILKQFLAYQNLLGSNDNVQFYHGALGLWGGEYLGIYKKNVPCSPRQYRGLYLGHHKVQN